MARVCVRSGKPMQTSQEICAPEHGTVSPGSGAGGGLGASSGHSLFTLTVLWWGGSASATDTTQMLGAVGAYLGSFP